MPPALNILAELHRVETAKGHSRLQKSIVGVFFVNARFAGLHAVRL